MSGPPPPPPPHGESPKTTGLPPGKYDVFIIPEHSAGSGFLYLPSLRTNTNSFVAGFASALVLVVMFQSMAPAFQAWWANFQGMGNMGMMMLVIAVGLGAWSLGRQQQDGPGGPSAGGGGSTGGAHTSGTGFSNMGSGPNTGQAPPPPPPNTGPPPNPPPPQGGPPPGTEKPKPSWQQRPPPQPQPNTTNTETPKNSWERAREETRRREEERKAKEEEQKRKEAAAQRLRELREKEAREREQREKERQEREAREKETKEKKEREIREVREKEQREREQREKERREREQREKELKERLERLEREAKEREEKRRKEEQESQTRKGSSYAFSGVGEKTNPWPNGKPPAASSQPASPRVAKPAASENATPTKKPPPPTARTFVGTDDDAYSFRPYDKPKRPGHRKSNSDLSESSWAPSQSTARTTPPPSVRGPYTTKDPDKIVIKAVYCFMNQYAKTPASQLISGVGSVTDGLILRITTEGLFIDDDVRNVPQREWDVKAWTLKAVEVWCPSHFLASANASNASPSAKPTPSSNINTAFFARAMGGTRIRAAERSEPKKLTGEAADAYLTDMLRACKDSCRLGLCASSFANLDGDVESTTGSSRTNRTSATQTGDWKAKGLHLLRATIRDQEGKRYLFVVSEEESWKVAVGLQRLRRGTQVRALGVGGLSGLETKSTLETLGWV